MDYSIRCDCGRDMVVSEGSAGARIPCECGQIVDVPSLGVLRTSIGLSAVDIPLEMEIWSKLDSGELPPPGCIGCGRNAETIPYVAECEQIHEQASTDKWAWFQGIVAGLGLLTNSLVFVYGTRGGDETTTTIHGREVYIPVPVRCCPHCRETLICEPTNTFWNKLGTLLLWSGLIGMVLFYYLIGAAALAAGIALQSVASTQQALYQRRLKDLLSSIPFYKRVFEKYPDAVVACH